MSRVFYRNRSQRGDLGLKGGVFLCLVLLVLPLSPAFAFNQEAKALLLALFEKGRVATEEELIEMLLPVADDASLTHMQKVRDMDYLVHITGWDLSKAERRTLYYRVDALLEARRKEAYLQEHPELDEQMRQAIRESHVFLGMSKEQVQASLGEPEEVRPPFGTFMNSERWSYYSKRMVIFFKDGQIISWKKLS